MRTYVYIDWFNFYKNMIENTPYQWLDIAGLIHSILNPINNVEKIRIFTAPLLPLNNDKTGRINQTLYHSALKKLNPEIKIHEGYFSKNRIRAPLADQRFKKRMVEVQKIEEKTTDVSLAVHLINDFWLKKYDCIVLISNDSDFKEALKVLKTHSNSVIGLLTPGSGKASKLLKKYSDFHRRIPLWVLRKNQLPKKIPGTNIVKPSNW